MIHIMISALLIGLAVAQTNISDGNLLSVISQYPQLSQLYAEVKKSDTLTIRYNAAELGDFTLLAPTNAALSTFYSLFTTNVSQIQKDALFSYHLLRGRYPTASIPASPHAVQSQLTDQAASNVTGGQRVELLRNDTIESGYKTVTKIITGVSIVSPSYSNIFVYTEHRISLLSTDLSI
jgi:hypothetical protein